MKTFQPKGKEIKRKWHLIDAKGKVLGRISTEIAKLLMGKHKVDYAPHMDMGDYVVVINAKDIVLTGRKMSSKVYRRHSGYPGGFKEVSVQKLMSEHPDKVIRNSVYGMIPTNRLTSKRMARLKIFVDDKHPYAAKFTTVDTNK